MRGRASFALMKLNLKIGSISILLGPSIWLDGLRITDLPIITIRQSVIRHLTHHMVDRFTDCQCVPPCHVYQPYGELIYLLSNLIGVAHPLYIYIPDDEAICRTKSFKSFESEEEQAISNGCCCC